MIFKLIACEVFTREMVSAAASGPHRVDLDFLPKGLHDLPPGEMPGRMQAALDAVAPGVYDAVLLGYGLCNNGLTGVTARDCPVVIPRAHDCMTLFLGSRQRYRDYFDTHPGTYFLTGGWIEYGETRGELAEQSVQRRLGMDRSLESLIAEYGEDNAAYLYETLCRGTRNYGRIAYVPMGVEPPGTEETARQRATDRNWQFERVPGDMRLIHRLVAGSWDPEDFLVVPPGESIQPTYDETIVTARPIAH